MTSRMARPITTFFALLASFLPMGCGAGLSSVTGSVTYKGKPATGAAVHFHREGATAQEEAAFPIAVVDADGNFTLETPGVGWGAKPGKYKVLVIWKDDKDLDAPKAVKSGRPSSKGRKDPKSDTDRLKFRYFNIDKPLLVAEVKPETNKLEPFELKD